MDLYKKADFCEKFIVENDRDGSGKFGLVDPKIKPLAVGHLQPGFQEYLQEYDGDFFDAIINPEPGYELAAGYIADWLRAFAEQEWIVALLSDAAAIALKQKFGSRRPSLNMVIKTKEFATNSAIETNEKQSYIVRHLGQYGWDFTGVEMLYKEMKAAEDSKAIRLD